MKKAKVVKAHRSTLTSQLREMEMRVKNMCVENERLINACDKHDREEGRLANENTRLSKIIDGLKEELFNKSLALAHAEGKLERVDHEDAERAEVIVVDDLQLTRIDHHSGAEISGGPVPIKRTVLKYELAKPSQPMRTGSISDGTLIGDVLRDRRDQYGNKVATERPKHWVNRY